MWSRRSNTKKNGTTLTGKIRVTSAGAALLAKEGLIVSVTDSEKYRINHVVKLKNICKANTHPLASDFKENISRSKIFID